MDPLPAAIPPVEGPCLGDQPAYRDDRVGGYRVRLGTAAVLLAAMHEAHRVLCPHGLLAVTASRRRNDPELAPVLPGWGEPLSFASENGPALLGQVFDVMDIQRWDAPVVRIPDRAGLVLYLRGRGLAEEHAHAA